MRHAEAADLRYILSLSRKAFNKYGPYEKIVDRWFESSVTITCLALMKERPAGFAMLSVPAYGWYGPGVSELLAIAVEPGKRKLGIGNLLLREVERRAEELKVEILVLHTATENIPGRKLFEKHGFTSFEVKKNFYPNGQDALMMYKDIVSSLY
jgi:ribosomal-protein-alanine N-acetyltransferase